MKYKGKKVQITVLTETGELTSIEISEKASKKLKPFNITFNENFVRQYDEMVIDFERNNERYNKHNMPLSGAAYEGEMFADKFDVEKQVTDKIFIDSALSVLSERERYIVDLVVIEGLTFVKIGQFEGKTEAAIRKVYHRAIAKLRDFAEL